jgi:hypothetical protein
MKEACIAKIQEVVAGFQSVCVFNLVIVPPSFILSCLSLRLLANGEMRKVELIHSDVKLLRTRLFEIIKIQKGLLILLLLLDRDYRYYAFDVTGLIYDAF